MLNKRFVKVWISLILSTSCITADIMPVKAVEASKSITEADKSYDISEYQQNEILVKVRSLCSKARSNEIFSDAKVVIEAQSDNYYVVKASNQKALEKAISSLESSTYIEEIQPNFTYEPADLSYKGVYSTGNMNYSKNQWALHNDGSLVFTDAYTRKKITAVAGIDVNVEPLWEAVKEKPSKKVIVAVIDSGVDLDQPALQGKLWKNTKDVAGDGIDNDGNGYIDDCNGWNTYSYNNVLTDEMGHGTHCAGIIAANGTNDVWGVTGESDVELMPVKVFSDSKNGNTSSCTSTSFSILRGLKYAKVNGASICNLSLGMREDDSLLQEYIFGSNMLFVCAAGNDGAQLEYKPVYPAVYDFTNVISVANIRCDGKLHTTSNYSADKVDVAAPGTEIYSTLPFEKYGYLTGTSMATPYVTGVAALLYSYSTNMTAAAAKKQITANAKPSSELSGFVKYGMLDAYDAYLTDVSAPLVKYKATINKAQASATIKLNIGDIGNAGVKAISWQQGKKTIADFSTGEYENEVSATDEFVVKTSGYYSVYAVDNNGNATVKHIKITIPVPTKVNLRRTAITINKGRTYTLAPTVSPSGVYVKYTFSSSNKNVATVSAKGKITARRAGKATVTIKTQNGKILRCRITVK